MCRVYEAKCYIAVTINHNIGNIWFTMGSVTFSVLLSLLLITKMPRNSLSAWRCHAVQLGMHEVLLLSVEFSTVSFDTFYIVTSPSSPCPGEYIGVLCSTTSPKNITMLVKPVNMYNTK